MGSDARYIVYRTVADGAEGVGYVVNALVWDGTGTTPLIPAGTALAQDAAQAYQIGSTYTAPTS